MSSDASAFLEAIEADRTNNVLRHVYADWLDERDNPDEANRQRMWCSAWKWMEEFAARCHSIEWGIQNVAGRGPNREPLTADEVILAGTRYVDYFETGGDSFIYFSSIDSEETEDLLHRPEVVGEFWHNYEIVTGRRIPAEYRGDGIILGCGCG